jgi:hypothetical protein
MATVNFVMQKKGGVGKSITATLLYQALLDAGKTVLGVDTDPSNRSLAGYSELNVTKLNILNNEEDIDKTMFDALIDSICELPEDAHVVIDNSASNFIPLCSYLKINQVLPLLAEMGHKVLFHVVIAGGADLGHTCVSLKELAVNFPEAPLVVWLNPYNGEIKTNNNKAFEDLKVFREHGHQIIAQVNISHLCQSAMFRKDLQNHFAGQTIFASVKMASSPSLMSKQRLLMFWNDTKRSIEAAGLLQ